MGYSLEYLLCNTFGASLNPTWLSCIRADFENATKMNTLLANLFLADLAESAGIIYCAICLKQN